MCFPDAVSVVDMVNGADGGEHDRPAWSERTAGRRNRLPFRLWFAPGRHNPATHLASDA